MSHPDYSKENPSSIQALFASIAPRYDLGNALISFSLHRLWNRSLVHEIESKVRKGGVYLDLCSGTGDIAMALLKQGCTPQKIILVDFCEEMLLRARKKFEKKGASPVDYIVSDALKVPLEDKCADAITIAYGIRNVASIDHLFTEVYRLLKPGGVFSILELTRPSVPFVRWAHSLYLQTLIPIIGKIVSKDKAAYEYLASSIQQFYSPGEITYSLNRAGFQRIDFQEKTKGIATLFTCQKI